MRMARKRQDKGFTGILKSIWRFIWYEESLASWIVNIALAFLLIKFVVYPGLGLALGTGFPVVAVVSESMEHEGDFGEWWDDAGQWYAENGITREEFSEFPLRNGFDKGDIIVLRGSTPVNTEVGDVIVFQARKPDPIIHRVVDIENRDGEPYYTTKGDNYRTNPRPIETTQIDETGIPPETVIGKAVFRIPLLGYIKIWFVDLLAAPYCALTDGFFPCRR